MSENKTERNIDRTEVNVLVSAKLLVYFMEQSLVNTLPVICNDLTEFCYFSRQCVCKTSREEFKILF